MRKQKSNLKAKALATIAKMPEKSTLDDIMYHLYVLDMIQKGQDSARRHKTTDVDSLQKEILKW